MFLLSFICVAFLIQVTSSFISSIYFSVAVTRNRRGSDNRGPWSNPTATGLFKNVFRVFINLLRYFFSPEKKLFGSSEILLHTFHQNLVFWDSPVLCLEFQISGDNFEKSGKRLQNFFLNLFCGKILQ